MLSENTYLNSLSQQVKSLLQGPMGAVVGLEPPQSDLVPSKNVGMLLNILKEILSVANMVEGRQNDTTKVIDYLFRKQFIILIKQY